jgi:hypothetical protein
MLNAIINKKYNRSCKESHYLNDTEEEWMCIKETLITSVQEMIGEKLHERNEEWHDQECREMIKVKREARLKCIQGHSTKCQMNGLWELYNPYTRKEINYSAPTIEL